MSLSNSDIEALAKKLKMKYFRGASMRDTLPGWVKSRECGIVNLDSIQNSGTHWTCYYRNKNKKYYFDSFGLDPPWELQKYLGKGITISTFKVQEFNTEYCGQLCIIVLYLLNKNYKFEEIIVKVLLKI